MPDQLARGDRFAGRPADRMADELREASTSFAPRLSALRSESAPWWTAHTYRRMCWRPRWAVHGVSGVMC